MDSIDLSDIYRGYIACLNKEDWSKLGDFHCTAPEADKCPPPLHG
ncbi:hypothetical protein [Paraburkholderia sp. UYCP14C]|nr:hypothetical protein [Paraburkholderia sp. UYCP14C]